ncbi:DUF418 domain-containing protein [Bisbaumannia pacifica]|uniref:DUF418 domain-containing protein n=1 Tax=Bisbaumannia pacifica TaxID=77098 RepID=A0ABD4L765_9GAMM|nr:DUF418 domain-containing protein [Halomonas pacifica]MBH8581658.1 DUF418 domain-containing protein [Halomonas pacifica]
MNRIRRSHEVDVIRMAALIGICVVNVPFMALPIESAFVAPQGADERTAAFVVECFFQLKFFLLFSFVFGWGMAIQSTSARSKGQSFARRYFCRMLGLAILGVAHATLVFSGDILVLYAVLGSLLWWIKDHPPRTLLRVAAWMLPLSMLCLTVLAVVVEMMMAADGASFAAMGSASLGGGFVEATRARAMEWPATFAFLLLLQGPLAFGAFAAGLAAAKADFFAEGSRGFALLESRLPLLVGIALPLNVLYAAVIGGLLPESYEVISLLGMVLVAIGAPALSSIYLYLLVRLSRAIELPRLLVLAGQNSLSSYVAQGVIAGGVFGAYGLGWFDSIGQVGLIPLSLVIALVAMLSVGAFAAITGQGPLEPVLRRISGNA